MININFNLIEQSLPALLQGTVLTLEIAALACCMGLAIGTLVALIQDSKKLNAHLAGKLLQILMTIYVGIIRGTPMLLQILMWKYIPAFVGLHMDDFTAATLAIGINSSAYISQTVLSGIKSVGSGQLEAATVLGLNTMQTIRYIVLPQAIRVVLPALGNEFITLIKDSSLAYIVGVMELTGQARNIIAQKYDAITIYIAVAAIYLVLTTTLSLILNQVDRKMNTYVKN
ncbi:MAG: ABC transporter [candidate division TM6 bacterium GW2011_GWF2_32_72]|nr:MAG: ABC transporter [candidate division TM6 bacterium GW2011_GWF2_32_72]